MQEIFRKFAQKASELVGSSWAFLLALSVIIVWGFTGPLFHFSDVWQLVINTGTSITTFLMVFLVQNTQNRETKATQLKLDELIRAQKSAHNTLMGIEKESDKRLDEAARKEINSIRRKKSKK